PHGMPRIMIGIQPLEIVITPQATYVMLELFNQLRRIYTDGRDWPDEFPRSTLGYSIGQWTDTDGDGRYDTLTVETRGLSGWRAYDSSGIPFDADGKAVIKERITLDKSNPNVLRNEITVIDNALTRPWTVNRSYKRNPEPQPAWIEYVCTEDNHHVVIGKENYVVNGEGYLMPVPKGHPPPNLALLNSGGKGGAPVCARRRRGEGARPQAGVPPPRFKPGSARRNPASSHPQEVKAPSGRPMRRESRSSQKAATERAARRRRDATR